MRIQNYYKLNKGVQVMIKASGTHLLKGEYSEAQRNALADKLRTLRILDNGSEIVEFYKTVMYS